MNNVQINYRGLLAAQITIGAGKTGSYTWVIYLIDLGQMGWGFVSNDFTPTQTLQAVSCMEIQHYSV